MAQMPKRRKSKDNPYTLYNDKDTYKISFKDVYGNVQCIEITEELYNVFNSFELEDLSQMNKFDRHIEHIEKTEEEIYNNTKLETKKLEDDVIEKMFFEKLYIAINKLPNTQKRRIKMYYFEGLTLKEIAQKENCHLVSVKDSITVGLKNLKKFLK